MSRITGFIAHNKKGRTISKVKIANKRKSDKTARLIPPAKAAEFVAKVKALARRYNIGIQNLKVR